MTFPQTTMKRRKQTKHKKNALVSSWNYLHERSLTSPKSTNSMTTSKLMCKPITSRTASVTCVSSARNTITRILQKPLRINPLPSDLLSDQTSIPLKQKTAPPIVSISYHSSVQHPISEPYFSSWGSNHGFMSKWFFEKKLCVSHPYTHQRLCV